MLLVVVIVSLAAALDFPSESRLPSAEESRSILKAASRPATVTRVLPGKFTQPDLPELMADLDGTEPHALSFGGSVLLRQVKGEWRFVRYAAGFRSTECRKFPRTDGTDLLLCHGGHTAMGENSTYLFSYDWKRVKGPKTILLQARSDRAKFERFEIADANSDGLPDLRVTVQAGKPMLVDFLFDGKGFRVSPATAAVKRKLDALSGGGK